MIVGEAEGLGEGLGDGVGLGVTVGLAVGVTLLVAVGVGWLIGREIALLIVDAVGELPSPVPPQAETKTLSIKRPLKILIDYSVTVCVIV